MLGLHLTADLHGCRFERPAMTDPDALRVLCLTAVQRVGLQAVGELFHSFAAPAARSTEPLAPAGVTGVVLLAESHLAVHTWPELDAVTLDVYVCNVGADNSPRAESLMTAMCAAFAPHCIERQALRRGSLSKATPPRLSGE
ncbi:MAG: S-adenosylmethionine decarboxylase [Pseudomonadota bacterium]|nr:S-adenosylmethionine decarboxylase [Pseudomonadota bacterium]